MLSRSDEIGSGRIDSLLSAAKVAQRYERDGDLASLVLGVIPVAGLVAEGARTLRESEYLAFRHLAGLERADRERLLVSADRFTRESDATELSTAERRELLARFGIFGVRLATALIRGGASSSTELSDGMVQQSGLIELQQFVRDQFRTRATTLKVRGVLLELERLLRDRPRAVAAAVHAGIERISAGAHELRELSLLAAARSEGLPLGEGDAADALTIIGARGTPAHVRLGLSETDGFAQQREQAAAKLAHWRRLAQSPLTDRATAGVCRVVIRSLEEIASGIEPSGDKPAGIDPIGIDPIGSEVGAADDSFVAAADVVLPRGPGDGLRQDAAQQGEKHETRLSREQERKRLTPVAERDPFS